MIRILLCGYNGTMGAKVREAAAKFDYITIAAGVDRSGGDKVYSRFSDVKEKIDVILDFSHPSLTGDVLEYASKNNIPLVIAATGHSPELLKLIEETAVKVPVLKSSNFSICVNRFIQTVADFAKTWDGDIEIIETHHNKKADAPSGTALTIADAILKARGFGKRVPGRTPQSGKREPGDIGISAVRGGVIAGEHEVRFFSDTNEVFMKQREYGKESFAEGALRACEFMVGKSAGKLYNMSDYLKNKTKK